jgi:hypothetical protein
MVDLPQVSRAIVTSTAPKSDLSAADVASPYTALAKGLESQGKARSAEGEALTAEAGGLKALGAGADEIAKPLARQAGAEAVTRDEAGNIKVDWWPILGAAGQEFTKAVKIGVVAEAEKDARRWDVEARQKFVGDPAGYMKAADAYRTTLVKSMGAAGGSEVAAVVGRNMDQVATEGFRGLTNQKVQLDLRTAQGRIDSEIQSTKDEMVALANQGDTGSPDFKRRADKLRTLYNETVSNPLMAYPKERANFELQQFDSEMQASAIAHKLAVEVYDTQGREAALKGAETILTDPDLKLNAGQRDAYYNRSVGAINARVRADAQETAAINTQIKAVDAIASQGYLPGPDKLATLKAAVAKSNDPDVVKAYEDTVANLPTVAIWRQLSPAQLEADLGRRAAQMRETGADSRSLALMKTGTDLLKTMRKEIGDDPLGWAERSGTVPVGMIDFAKPDATTDMRTRISAADIVAQQYGIAPTYLRPEERRFLEVQSAAGGDAMLVLAQRINTGFGDRAPKVLGEISTAAPVLSHMGGLLTGSLFGGGSTTFANDVAEGVQLNQNAETKKMLPHWAQNPTDRVMQFQTNRRVDQFGDAFLLIPENGRAASESARNAFTVRAMRNGYDPSGIDLGGTTAKAYNTALQESAGATFASDGTQYGGITSYGTKPGTWFGSNKVLVPSNIKTGEFGRVIGAVTDEDLKLMPISPADGYKASDIRNAVPVAVPGGYRFAQGDPASADPKWVRGADGRQFVLPLDKLEPVLRTRVPGAFLGSR